MTQAALMSGSADSNSKRRLRQALTLTLDGFMAVLLWFEDGDFGVDLTESI